jgi:hypothetical protein
MPLTLDTASDFIGHIETESHRLTGQRWTVAIQRWWPHPDGFVLLIHRPGDVDAQVVTEAPPSGEFVWQIHPEPVSDETHAKEHTRHTAHGMFGLIAGLSTRTVTSATAGLTVRAFVERTAGYADMPPVERVQVEAQARADVTARLAALTDDQLPRTVVALLGTAVGAVLARRRAVEMSRGVVAARDVAVAVREALIVVLERGNVVERDQGPMAAGALIAARVKRTGYAPEAR